jgi:hypothetical protein
MKRSAKDKRPLGAVTARLRGEDGSEIHFDVDVHEGGRMSLLSSGSLAEHASAESLKAVAKSLTAMALYFSEEAGEKMARLTESRSGMEVGI